MLVLYKGITKKLGKLAKLSDCKTVSVWRRSINNRVYWVAQSREELNGYIMEAKWLSLANHIKNVHTGHSVTFPDCLHETLHR